jgi:serine/threonine-protein kinase
MSLDPDRWRAVSPFLDQALEMPEAERTTWLGIIRRRDPSLADDLELLLDQHGALSRERFLEQGPEVPLGLLAFAGQKLGAYTLHSPIGQGGMGTVWLAERTDGRFERKAAIKFLNVALAGRGEERFRREGRILGRLEHPHIAQLTDAGVSATGQPYLVLEHVEGEPIDQYCDHHGLDTEARLRLFLDVLDAVAHAHANLIVHRDIKPSNVFVTRDGRVKLLDFGIAKLIEDEDRTSATLLTRDGGTALTPAYAAPEQVTGAPVSTATDVYALGVLLYLLLTGHHPASEHLRSPVDLLKAIVDTEPRRPSVAAPERLRRALAGDLDVIVLKTLKKDPKERYASVTALADDLRRVLRHEPIGARPDTLAYRSARFVRRNRAVVALASLFLVAIAGGLVGTVSQARRATAQAARADEEARSAVAQRDFALQQLTRAEAINDLNSLVLSEGSKLGDRFTVAELMTRAERVVAGQQGSAIDVPVELLLAIGYQYQNLDEHAKARAVLTQAYELAAKSADGATRAKAGCALASAVGQAGQSERAEQLLKAAEAELPDGPQFALHRVFCFEMGSVVASNRGDAQVAIERAEAAQRTLSASRFESPVMDLRISGALAAAYGFAGRYRESASLWETASRQIVPLGREDTRMAATIHNNWANALLSLGRPLQAEALLRKALQIGTTTEEEATPLTLNNLARALRDLGRVSEAARYAELAHTNARRMGQEIAIDATLFVRAAIYRAQGDLARAERMVAEVAPRLERLPPGHINRATLAWERSQLAQARGDLGTAMTEADRAVSIASPRGGQQLARNVLRRSEVAFASNHFDRAAADAEEALRLESRGRPPGDYSNLAGLIYLALGRARQQQGRIDQAQSALTSALEHLRPTIGEDHPSTRGAAASLSALSSSESR